MTRRGAAGGRATVGLVPLGLPPIVAGCGAMRQGVPVWTRNEVEARLVAAFRASGGFVAQTAWMPLLDADPAARKALWAWARCRAGGESFAALCREMGWPATTAEAGRRRGAAAIAVALGRSATVGCFE